MPRHDLRNIAGNLDCRNNLSRGRGQSSGRNKEIGIDNTVNRTSYFVNSPLTISMVPRAISHVIPNQSSRWQGFQTDFSSFDTKPCLIKISFHSLSHSTAHLAIFLNAPAIVEKNGNTYVLMSPMFLYRLQSFGEKVRCR